MRLLTTTNFCYSPLTASAAPFSSCDSGAVPTTANQKAYHSIIARLHKFLLLGGSKLYYTNVRQHGCMQDFATPFAPIGGAAVSSCFLCQEDLAKIEP